MGVEPTYQPWEGRILPMNYIRIFSFEIMVYIITHPTEYCN